LFGSVPVTGSAVRARRDFTSAGVSDPFEAIVKAATPAAWGAAADVP
jgi:hypothetical protein